MSNYQELREISLDFRRLSSNFLNARNSNAAILIQRFKAYIDGTPFIADLIERTTSGVQYDYRDCFRDKVNGGWSDVIPPVDEASHVKAMYDYLSVIIQNGSNVLGVAMHYCASERNLDQIIRYFLEKAFKPLIDFINDAISKEIMMTETKQSQPILTQKIENVYGTVNQQGSGTINSTTYVYPSQADQILELLSKIIPTIDMIADVPEIDKDNVKDDLLSIEEQIKTSAPRKSRLQRAIMGVKKFLGECSSKIAVSLATSTVTNLDWEMLIGKVEEFIGQL